MSNERTERQEVTGVIVIDKSVGPSSQQVVSAVKRMFNARKAGHGGTLDPLASGVLVVGLGEATKYLQRHLEGEKRYLAHIRFGAQTATGDREGEVIASSPARPTHAELAATLQRFLGEHKQTPPMYSALKIQGKPAYALARAGVPVQPAPRTIRLSALVLHAFDGETAEIEVTCSAGTYIRSLAQDIALACGTVAHLAGLRRTGTRAFAMNQALTLDALASMDLSQRLGQLQPPDALLCDLPAISVPLPTATALGHGKSVIMKETSLPNSSIRLYADGLFFGLAACDGHTLSPNRWMSRPIRSFCKIDEFKAL